MNVENNVRATMKHYLVNTFFLPTDMTIYLLLCDCSLCKVLKYLYLCKDIQFVIIDELHNFLISIITLRLRTHRPRQRLFKWPLPTKILSKHCSFTQSKDIAMTVFRLYIKTTFPLSSFHQLNQVKF